MTTMKRRRHTPEQAVRKVREGERMLAAGSDLTEVLRHLEITESTWHRWRRAYAGMSASDAKRLKELESENAPAQEAVGGGRAGQGDAQGAGRGKMVTPDRRRVAVERLQERFGVSERRACRVVGQHRSTQRRPRASPDAAEQRLRAHLRDFARRHPRLGWRKAHAVARREGLVANPKRTRRLWRDERLQRPPQRRAKRRRLTDGTAARLRRQVPQRRVGPGLLLRRDRRPAAASSCSTSSTSSPARPSPSTPRTASTPTAS